MTRRCNSDFTSYKIHKKYLIQNVQKVAPTMTLRAQQLTSLPRIILENYPKLADNSQIIHNNGWKKRIICYFGMVRKK